MACLDPPTHLANRRFLDAKLRHCLDELALFGRNFGVLLLDLNRFKRINDSFDHSAGDAVLEHVAHTIFLQPAWRRYRGTLGRRRILSHPPARVMARPFGLQ